jgi:glycosyltransferase involved in cell wall biosynthesis
MEPTVSVIIPAYNVAQFIGETLDSVLAQTFTDYEVIVINDGSPDVVEFEEILKPYLQRILYIKQENHGAASARNRGLQEARGEFIAFLDADDLWAKNYLEEQLKFINSTACDLVYSDALITGDSPLAGRTFMETAPSEGEVTVRSLLRATCNVITSGVLARKQPILDCGRFDETLRNSHDFDLWVRLAKQGNHLAYQRKVLLQYRCHDNSLSGDAINNVVRQLRVYDKFERCYDLSREERADVSHMLGNLRAELELETGKMHLAQGNFADARNAFETANKHYRKAKLSLAIFLLKFSPRLLFRLYGTLRK